MTPTERRQHPRRSFEGDVYTYIDGNRLDSESIDVSEGGALFRTDQELPIGAHVAMVFKKQAQLKEPVFLIGRVQRRHTDLCPGVGLQWTKAVTQAAPSELIWFLATVLGVKDAQVDHAREPGHWNMLAMHRFPGPTAPGGAGVDAGEGGESLVDAARLAARVLSGDRTPDGFSPKSPGYSRTDEDGSLTVRIAKSGLRAPAGLDGILDTGEGSESVRITHLGSSSLFVQTGAKPPAQSDSIRLSFEVPAKGGGIPEKFVRWLHFQALTVD